MPLYKLQNKQLFHSQGELTDIISEKVDVFKQAMDQVLQVTASQQQQLSAQQAAEQQTPPTSQPVMRQQPPSSQQPEPEQAAASQQPPLNSYLSQKSMIPPRPGQRQYCCIQQPHQ
ncbi:hypothetical protein KEM55_007093 [Ascosphaera atra]|nr:hypothetical protein KEM55_007093 [Ascosphaera atra]